MWKFWKKEKEHYLLTTVSTYLSIGELDRLRQYRDGCREYNQRHNINIPLDQWIKEKEKQNENLF